MRKILLTLLFCLFAYSITAAEPYQVRRDNVPIYTSPNTTQTYEHFYFYGDTISAIDYSSLLVEIILKDGKKGYVKKEAIIKADSGFDRLPLEEKLAVKLYRITSATVVFMEPRLNSERIVSLRFINHQILYDAVPVNDEWMSIPIGGSELGYVRSYYLNNVSHEDKLEMFAPWMKQDNETVSISTKTTEYIQGGKSGPKFVYLILAVCLFLLGMSIFRHHTGPMKGKTLGLYVSTLIILSLFEIWYFYSMGMEEVYWFLSFDHIGRTILFVAVLVVFTWIQLSAGLNIIDDTVKVNARQKRKYLWLALGIIIGMALSWIYRIIVGINISVFQFGSDTVVFQIIGQLPMGVVFARNLKKRFNNKKTMFIICYAIISGTVVSLIMGSLLIFILFGITLAIAAIKPIPMTQEQIEEAKREEKWQNRCREEEHAKVTDLRNRGKINSYEEERMRENIRDTHY